MTWTVPEGTDYSWQTANPALPGETGNYSYPDRLLLDARGHRGAPDVSVVIEMRDAVPEVVEFHLVAKPHGRGVRTADLNAWQPIEGLAINGLRQHARRTVQQPGEEPVWAGPPFGPATAEDFWRLDGSLREAQQTRTGPSRAELEEVARVYTDAVHAKPVEAVLDAMEYGSRRTAARRVQQARQAGLLPPTSQGRKNA